MPDVLPCPNPLCTKSLPFAEAFKVSCYSFGTSGAIHVDRDKARAAWNALPRQPQWTEYDGSEKTLPPEGGGEDEYCIDGRVYRYVGSREDIQIGERWMPWPLPGGGE